MRKEQKRKFNNRLRRKHRTSVSIGAAIDLPRLSIYKSLKHFYAQIIDDVSGKTLCAVRDGEVKGEKLKPVELAFKVGELLGKKATEKKITEVRFDRGYYRYHGAVKALADGARQGGIKF